MTPRNAWLRAWMSAHSAHRRNIMALAEAQLAADRSAAALDALARTRPLPGPDPTLPTIDVPWILRRQAE